MSTFDVAIGMSVERFLQGLTLDLMHDVFNQCIRLEVGHRACLGCRYIGGIADHPDVFPFTGLQGGFVRGNEIEIISQTRLSDEIGAHVRGNGHQQVVIQFPTVERAEHIP